LFSAQDEPDYNQGYTKNQWIEYPQREVVATRVAIIVQREILDQQNEKTSDARDEYAQREQFLGGRQRYSLGSDAHRLDLRLLTRTVVG